MMIEKVVPFKFNDAYFKRWVINLKRNNIGRYLKPKKDWRGNWNTN